MLIERDTPVDWKALLLELVRWGWTLHDIATAINVPPSTLGGWWYENRPEPRFSDGRALMKLHEREKKRRCGTGTGDQAVQSAR